MGLSITQEIQVYFNFGTWKWRHVNLLTSAQLDHSDATFATPQLAKADALAAHPTIRVEYFWVSEAGPEWHRYQDA